MKGGYKDLWKAIIRPDRDIYDESDLGPHEFTIKNTLVNRNDFILTNTRGLKLKPCSRLPCVVYLHGNSSSRMEAISAISILIPQNIQLFTFDFSGCGLSDGEYISLGWYEKDDVDLVVQYLRNTEQVSTIGLWGRSMGAITAMMHADRDHSIAGLVLDSGFVSLKQLASDLCKQYTKLPKFIISIALSFIRSTIKQKNGFDIYKLTPIQHVEQTFIPAFFIAAKSDTFILPSHTEQLYQQYQGDKNIKICDGDHNSPRPQYILDSIAIFFYNTLQCEQIIRPTSPQILNRSSHDNRDHNHQIRPNWQEIKNIVGDIESDIIESDSEPLEQIDHNEQILDNVNQQSNGIYDSDLELAIKLSLQDQPNDIPKSEDLIGLDQN